MDILSNLLYNINLKIRGSTMSSNLVKLLNTEKELNRLLNSKKCPDNIDSQFHELFENPYYAKTHQWLDKDQTISLHDGNVRNFSERKKFNGYEISFKIDNASIYEDKQEISYLSNSKFTILSKQSLRMINNRRILNFLIDEDKKEVAFIFDDNGYKKITSLNYSDIEFIKGQ
jgi:hypothetical protein